MRGPRVKVVTYKGDKAAARGIEKMLSQGWELQDQATRKMLLSWKTGIFTRKQKHTVTFVRKEG